MLNQHPTTFDVDVESEDSDFEFFGSDTDLSEAIWNSAHRLWSTDLALDMRMTATQAIILASDNVEWAELVSLIGTKLG